MLQSQPPIHRVFVVGENTLFEEGIVKMLSLGTELTVTGTKYIDDPALLDALEINKPDVILLNETMSNQVLHILELLLFNPALTALYLVVIRLDSNMVDVYPLPRRFAINQRDELVALVQGNFDCQGQF